MPAVWKKLFSSVRNASCGRFSPEETETTLPETVNRSSPPSTSSPQDDTWSEILESDDIWSERDLENLICNIDYLLPVLNRASSIAMFPSKFMFSDLAGSTCPQYFSALFEGISKGAQILHDETQLTSNLLEQAQSEALAVLTRIKKSNFATTCFILLAHVLVRIQTRPHNKSCFYLLNRMSNLAKCVRRLKPPHVKTEMYDEMYEAAVLIIQVAIICCSQMAMEGTNSEDFLEHCTRVDFMYRDFTFEMLMNGSINPWHTAARPYPEYAVGIKEQVKNVIHRLKMDEQDSAIAVVVHGNGGSGKTTVADAVYSILNLIGYCYSKVSLDENPNIPKLQTNIVRDLGGLQYKEEIQDIRSGQKALVKIIQQKPVLLYIDNVLKKDDLQKLLPEKIQHPTRMRLLITSRDTSVLKVLKDCGIEEPVMYKTEPLSHESAMEILCRGHGQMTPRKERPEEFKEISKKFCDNPLILGILGAYLHRNGDAALEKVLKWVHSARGNPLSVLERTFASLESDVQEAFLDICTFFQGWKWNKVEAIVGEEELKILEDVAFVQKDLETVRVHPPLRDFSKRRDVGLRLTNWKEISAALEDKKEIKGIWLLKNKIQFNLFAERLEAIHGSLRILALGDRTKITKGKCNEAFKNLRFFQAGQVGCSPFPDITKLDNLRYLHDASEQGTSKSEEHVPGPEASAKLRVLKLHGFVGLPKNFKGFTQLTVLELSGYGVEQLSDTLCNLNKLQKVILRNLKNLKSLPDKFGDLCSLKKLDLSHCTSLEVLPKTFGNLRLLEEAYFNSCESLQALPEDFGALLSLKVLDLSYCLTLSRLPRSLRRLHSLTTLVLNGCEKIVEFPIVGDMTSLLSLRMNHCDRFRYLSDGMYGLCNLVQLQSITLDSCYPLTELPEQFGRLKGLEDLSLHNCICLERLPASFPKLTSLRTLDLSDCRSLSRLPEDFHELIGLQELDLTGCRKLEELPTQFCRMPSLKTLKISECELLRGTSMDVVVKMQSLTTVTIEGNWRLEDQWEQMKETQEWRFKVITHQGPAGFTKDGEEEDASRLGGVRRDVEEDHKNPHEELGEKDGEEGWIIDVEEKNKNPREEIGEKDGEEEGTSSLEGWITDVEEKNKNPHEEIGEKDGEEEGTSSLEGLVRDVEEENNKPPEEIGDIYGEEN